MAPRERAGPRSRASPDGTFAVAGHLDWANHGGPLIIDGCDLCKLNGIDPFAYLRDVLVRRHRVSAGRIYDVTLRGWKAALEAGRFTIEA